VSALRQLRSTRHLVSATVFQSPVTALVLSRLDYGNGTLIDLPIYLIRRLQSVQNAAPRLIFRLRRSDQITDTLIGYECRKGLCSRSQCRPTGHCTVMPLITCGSLHQSPTSRPDKDFGLPPRTICAFLPSDCLLLDVVLSLSLALVFGTLFLPTSLQHLLCSLSENV